MILLCVDTSGSEGSIALAQLGEQNLQIEKIEQVTWLERAMHSEIATVELERLMRQNQLTLPQLTHLAVNVGPGSFTGLRVGINLVKTLAYALGLPVIPLNCLEILAFKYLALNQTGLLAIKAIRDHYYAAVFTLTPSCLETQLKPHSVDAAGLDSIKQNCTKVWIEGQTPGFTNASEAKDLARWLSGQRIMQRFMSWKNVEPLYIRASEAEEKLKKQLLKPI